MKRVVRLVAPTTHDHLSKELRHRVALLREFLKQHSGCFLIDPERDDEQKSTTGPPS